MARSIGNLNFPAQRLDLGSYQQATSTALDKDSILAIIQASKAGDPTFESVFMMDSEIRMSSAAKDVKLGSSGSNKGGWGHFSVLVPVKMQSATVASTGRPSVGLRRGLGLGVARMRSCGLSMQELGSRPAPLAMRAGMGMGMARFRIGVETFLRPRFIPVQAQSSAFGELEDKPQPKSSGTVLPYVVIACLGVILFGYHLGVVNGALEYLSRDLGIADNPVLQGWVVSISLAGATVGSFTGGALADKFGRKKAFMHDAVPLAVDTFLSATAQSVQTMMIGRLRIGIGISSAIVPLYISEVHN